MNNNENIFILYLLLIFIILFIFSGYFILRFNSVESYIIVVLIYDFVLLAFNNFLLNNQYVIFNKKIDFKSFYLLWLIYFALFGIILFPKINGKREIFL